MTEASSKDQSKQDQPQAGKAQPPKPSSGPASSSGSDQPATFGDGSTQAEQDRLVAEAEEANKAVKEFADAERDARSQ